MPAYDYRCTQCTTTFEVVRSITDRSEQECPSCGGQTKRVFSPVGVHFKGSGFHNTDYRAKPTETDTPKAAPCGADKTDSAACSTCPASGTSDTKPGSST